LNFDKSSERSLRFMPLTQDFDPESIPALAGKCARDSADDSAVYTVDYEFEEVILGLEQAELVKILPESITDEIQSWEYTVDLTENCIK